MLMESINLTKRLCVIEEGNSFGAYSSEIVTSLIKNETKEFSILRGSNNSIIPSSRELENKVLPTKATITSAIIIFVR
tara:strand:- start:1326 stop:1559 length:234 start_codon:yes stop_codon:yes gene_type:complete